MDERMPRLDGLYVSSGKDYSSCLKFHAGGKVSTVSVSPGGNPAKIFGWLTPDHPHASQGTYAVANGQLRFSAVSESGQVIYEGQIRNDRATQLYLHSHSMINGNQTDNVYDFTPVSPGMPHSSQTRFAVNGMIAGQLNIGPRVRLIDADAWPVISFSLADGKESVSVDFPIETAQAVITEMKRIIDEYGDGSEVPRNWDTPWLRRG